VDEVLRIVVIIIHDNEMVFIYELGYVRRISFALATHCGSAYGIIGQ